jgi:hypothetical protein
MSHNPDHNIASRYSAYTSESSEGIFLVLQAYNYPEWGLYHETTRIAEGIIAGNVWNGYSAYSTRGEPVGPIPNAILWAGRDYFFCRIHGVELEASTNCLP